MTYRTAVIARRMSAPPPPSVTASGEVVGSDFGRHDEHPGASMSVAWMPIGRACQQPAFTVSDVRRSQRTTCNTSIKSRGAQDPVPILVTGHYLLAPPDETLIVLGPLSPARATHLAGVPRRERPVPRLLAPAGQLGPGGVEVKLGTLGPGAQLAA